MSKLSNFELEFEIITLSNNIPKLKNLGFHTQDLECRLEYCCAELAARKLLATSEVNVVQNK